MKTYVAVRPGFQQQAIAAFGAEMELVVDDTLQQDYEFRQRDLGLADFLEAELEEEEAVAAKKADPKNAFTFVIPLVVDPDDLEYPQHLTFLTVRIDKNADSVEAGKVITDIKPIVEHDDAINVRATINALHNELKRADIKVHSISTSRGLTLLKS